MGRGCVVDEGVEGYLCQLCVPGTPPVTGVLVGQSSAQRDFVVMAMRTPQKEGLPAGSSLDNLDMEWVTEHAQQVSSMLPGGLSVLGVFIISSTEAKDTQSTLRQLVFSVERLISGGRLWSLTDDDITERIALHISAKTRKSVCRTFDVKDPKSTARPADWRSQAGVCLGWAGLVCSVGVELQVELPEKKTSLEDAQRFVQGELKLWAQQIENGVCLIDGKKLFDDSELLVGQKKSLKQTFQAQLLVNPCVSPGSVPVEVQSNGGCMLVRGSVQARAFIHNNRPTALQAEKFLKRDIVSTVSQRVQMLLEELTTSDAPTHTDRWSLPCRVFCPVTGVGPVCVCDYLFSDEGRDQVIDRLKEILDIDQSEEELDITQETQANIETETGGDTNKEPSNNNTETGGDTNKEPSNNNTETGGDTNKEPSNNNTGSEPAINNNTGWTGVAMATAVTLLATAASLLYLNDY